MRVLVCGSRSFGNDDLFARSVLWDLLWGIYESWSWAANPEDVFEVMQGCCPYGGADKWAEQWADDPANHAVSARFPAESNTARAYHARNQAMVNNQPDLVLAFIDKPLEESRGTLDTVTRAEEAGIRTVVISVIDNS